MVSPVPEFSSELLRQHAAKPRVIFIVGPTASGKSDLAIELAKKMKGEILSADSMQVYRGMDIGTAKLSPADWQGIPHHGIDLVSASESYSVYDYRKYALLKLREIHERGQTPIVTGGSGLYVRALLEGLPDMKLQNDAVRERLENRIEGEGLDSLLSDLKKIDAEYYELIDKQNPIRVIRALEIYEVSGQKPSLIRERREKIEDLGYFPVVLGIDRDRDWLYEHINARVDKMFAEGLVDEVKKLAHEGFSKTAAQAVGYKEIVEALALPGMLSSNLEAAKVKIKQASRNFAKRQWTWFKRERGIHWAFWPSDTAVDMFSQYVASHLKYAHPL